MRELADHVFHGANVVELRPHVAVEHPEAAEQALTLEVLDGVEQLSYGQPELPAHSGGFRPATDAGCGELGPDPEVG